MFLISQKCFLELLLHDSGVADLRFSRGGGGGGGVVDFQKNFNFKISKNRVFLSRASPASPN